ncbi:MAG: tandem-95 repeat protein [Chitinophagaceae bacterium]|nr:tandem-95 repeat protein [Chitinophagaceae bacterium]
MKSTLVYLLKADKAISRILLFAVYCIMLVSSPAIGQTVTKQFYLSDPSQALDRVDPVATADATIAQTAALTPTSQYLYAFRGAARTDFWRYSIASNAWTAMASTPGTVSRGAALATNGTYIYALRGNTTDFWRYDPATNGWSVMASAPSSVSYGAALVHVNGIIYALQGGNNNTFWKYTIATNTWSVVATTSANVGWGGSLTTNGTDVFALRGAGTNAFWKYTVATNTWSALASLPAAADGGGSLSFDGNAIYALRGATTNNFYKYNVSTNTWSTLANTPNTIYRGGALASNDPTSYALRGSASNSFYAFNGTSWSSLANTPSNVDSGGAVIKLGITGKTTSFTKSPAFCSAFTIKAGTVTVNNYISIVYGTMPANPAITATLRYGATNVITLSNPVYNSATGLLTWTGTLAADVTVPAAQALVLDITTNQPNVSFMIQYDSQTKPSKIDLQTSTNVNITSVNVYNAAYPLGSIVTNVLGGATRYIRTTVTNPTGNADITGVDVTVTPPGTTTASTQVAASGCTKVYESVWAVPNGQPSFTISATAKDGYENTITHSRNITVAGCSSCPPSANLDIATGNGGEPLDIDVLANDTDPNNDIDPASLTVTVQPKNGDVIIDNNKITYLPNGTFQGNDTLTYEICDNSLPTPLCSSTQVIITILPVAFNTCADATQPKTYYIPYAEDAAQVALVKSGSVSLPTTNIRTIISIKVSYPGMTLVWDHWEDGYEANIVNPTQSSTQVWGDGNLYNGIAPGYPTDIIPPGASIVLDNTMPTPRVASNLFFDGKDKLYTTGQVSVTQVCGEPSTIAVQCMKTNVTSFPNEYGKQFTLPVGQDLPSRDFQYTALFIRASSNNTAIQIDRDNDGDFETNFTLNEGQVMRVDDATAPAGVKIKAGSVITSDKPIGVDAHFAGVDNFSSREIPVFPATWYSNTYYTPVPTTGPGTAPHDTAVVMLYNSLNRDININWTSGTPSSGTILLRANSSERFAMPLSSSVAYKFVNPTKESFVALEIVDSYTPGGGGNDGSTRDWAFNLISEARLTDFASIAWGPGSTDMTRNDNPIWVTPSANTTVYVKYDGDVLNGVNISPCGLKYDVAIPVNYLNHIRIKDASDNNQSGTAVYTCNGAKIAAVYGEDPETALTANPSWDVGSTIQPFCKEKLLIANDDYAVTMINTPVTINVIKNDAGFLSIIDPATVSTAGLEVVPQHGTIKINRDGSIVYIPNPGFSGQDTFQYTVCSTPFPVVCATATVYINISGCPSPSGMNIISGQVFLDKNQDGVKNDGGTGLSPAKIYLYIDGNCNNSINTNELVDSANVDINGYYQFIKAPEKIVADNFGLPGGGNSCASGSDGTALWKNDWKDAADPSSGFCVSPAQSAANTDVEIVQDSTFGYALRLDDVSRSATREFNLEFATKAFLNFSYRKATTSLTTGENIFVQLSNDGSTFNTIYTISGNGTYNASYVDIANIPITVATYNSSNKTFIRFATSSNVDEGDLVFIDNVSLKFLQYDQCYLIGVSPTSLPANVSLTTSATQAFKFNTSGTCANSIDFGLKRISTYSVNDENSTWKDVNVSGVVKINDFDQEGNAQTFGSFLNPLTKATIASGTSIGGTDKTGAAVVNAGAISFDATGKYSFDPSPTFTGTVNIPYRTCDNGSPAACDTAYLAITVDPLPATGTSVIANNDEDISYGTAISNNLFANDRDPKNYSFTLTLFSYDTNGDGIPDITTMPGTATIAGVDIYNRPVANAGSLIINANGAYTFTPVAGFAGSADAAYVISNTAGAVASANLHIDVLSDINGTQNDPPFAGDDFAFTTVNQPVAGSFISNDRDANNDTLSFNGTTLSTATMANAIGAPVATAQGGTVQFYSNGTYTYTPPAGYMGPDFVTYTICDVTTTAPQPLCGNAIIHFLIAPGINISGKVWDDGNGNIIPETSFENTTNGGGLLYVNLVDALGYVVASVPVASNGTYSFNNAAPGMSYSIVLSTNQGVSRSAAPAASLPDGWANTGETRNGTIDYGAPGVIDSRAFGYTSVVNLDFGIEQLPSSVPFCVNIPQPFVGQFITLDGAANASGGTNPPVLSGKDLEDCPAGCTLSVRSVIIDAVPTNADLYYNGVLVTSGQLITNFNPALLQVQFTAVTIGSNMTQFYYSFVDSAGKKDPATAIYSLNWLILLPAKGLELTAIKAGNNVSLNWKTISEINSDYFEIERSTDGRNYVKVGSNIKAAGNSDAEKQYQTTDDISNLQTPLVYYRVNLTDRSNKHAYSNVATVKLPENGAVIKVVPNPFISEITITVSVEQNSSFGIRMMDMSGRTISSNTQKITREMPVVTLRNLNNLTRGVYLVEITDIESGKKRVFKVEKAN